MMVVGGCQPLGPCACCRPREDWLNPGGVWGPGSGGSPMGQWFLCGGIHRWACFAWACPERNHCPAESAMGCPQAHNSLCPSFSPRPCPLSAHVVFSPARIPTHPLVAVGARGRARPVCDEPPVGFCRVAPLAGVRGVRGCN